MYFVLLVLDTNAPVYKVEIQFGPLYLREVLRCLCCLRMGFFFLDIACVLFISMWIYFLLLSLGMFEVGNPGRVKEIRHLLASLQDSMTMSKKSVSLSFEQAITQKPERIRNRYKNRDYMDHNTF